MSGIPTCNHVHDDGQICRAAAIRNQPFCHFHRRYYQPPALPGDKTYQAPLLESNHALQLALTHLYQSFLSRKIDLKEATFALHVLRLAAKTVIKTSALPFPDSQRACLEIPDGLAQHLAKLKVEDQAPRIETPVSADPSPAFGSTAVEVRKPPQAAEPRRGIYDPYGCFPNAKQSGGK